MKDVLVDNENSATNNENSCQQGNKNLQPKRKEIVTKKKLGCQDIPTFYKYLNIEKYTEYIDNGYDDLETFNFIRSNWWQNEPLYRTF